MTPVSAEAEYIPHASTTYADSGTIVISSVDPIIPTESRRRGAGNFKCAIQPYASTVNGRRIPPEIASGKRYSGQSFFDELLSLSRMYMRSSVELHNKTLTDEPMPATCQLELRTGERFLLKQRNDDPI